MRKLNILLMILFVTCWQAGTARADEVIATIQIGKVSERSIFAGLGGNKNPVSELTEFFVPENNTPFISVVGAYQALYTDNHVYLIETAQGAISICGKPDDAQTCAPCPDCIAAKESLLALDVSQTQGRYKEHRATFTYSAKAGRADTGIEFHKPSISGRSTAYITGRQTSKNVPTASDRFSGKAYLFKAEIEKDYHLCPQPSYDSASCLICADCVGKEMLFDPITTDKTPH